MNSLDFTEIILEQGSEGWLAERLPLITGSRFKDVLAKNQGKTEAAARRNYRAELVIQRTTGKEIERYKSKAMEWGNETEDTAAVEYMLKTGNKVTRCGLFKHSSQPIGVSPDRRLLSLPGCVEIKCYEVANHIAALRSGHMPPEHKPQVQGEIWATDSEFCDFVSYAPELPPNATLFIERIYRDDEYIARMFEELVAFDAEVKEEVNFVMSYKLKGVDNVQKDK